MSADTPVRPPAPPLPPSWWRHGNIPLLALVCSGFAADFMFGTLQGLGIGTALGILLYTAAFLMLRTDISRKEQWFLGVMAVLNATAAGLNLSPDSDYNLLVAMFLPLAVIFLPQKEGNGYVPGTRYTSWLEYKFFRMNQARKAAQGLRGKLPLAASIAVGIFLFLFFLSIFADGNPVVASVRTAMNELAVRYLSWLLPSRETFVHMLLWVLGSLSFGILTMHRKCTPFGGDRPLRPEKPWLPSLPAISLLFINLAFLVNNGTDMAFLWSGTVPEGISQTGYLHEGADSLTLAAILSALILLVMFRSSGSVRASKTGTVLGFLLAVQTGLIAASVAVRLYNQIEDFGFSPTRVTAGIYLLLGACFLGLLFVYMAGSGNWERYGMRCGALSLVFLCLAGFRSPSQLSGDLNLMTMDSHPNWYFSDGDLLRFGIRDNFPFAAAVYQRLGGDTAAGANSYRMIDEAISCHHISNWRSLNLQGWRQKCQDEAFSRLPVPTAEATYGTKAWTPSRRPTGMRPEA
ncbi:DUF4153 domain-containing protein [Akkermansia sp.]|nr:DUF4153 domain-containing protein [uncultured Akkermansia sp.]